MPDIKFRSGLLFDISEVDYQPNVYAIWAYHRDTGSGRECLGCFKGPLRLFRCEKRNRQRVRAIIRALLGVHYKEEDTAFRRVWKAIEEGKL